MSELAHTDEVVTKEYLSQFYQDLLPYLGGAIPSFANKFNRSDIITTDEKIVGAYLGKPMYQKTIQGVLPDAVAYGTIVYESYPIGASVDSVVSYYGQYNPNGLWHSFPIDIDFGNQWNYAAKVLVSDNLYTGGFGKNVVIVGNADIAWNGSPFTITVKYTKTTDTANSFKYSDSHDYSTSETIVGTWIDGKPIYQRTVQMVAPNVTTDGTAAKENLDITSWNLNECLGLEMVGHKTNTSYFGHGGYFSSDGHYQLKAYVYRGTQLTVSSQNSSLNGITVYVTVRYTKNT